MSKKKLNSGGLIYSTDPDFKIEEEHEEVNTLLPAKQQLKVKLDKHHRAGKIVTLILNFEGKKDDMEELGKKIKSFCGTGGSVKDGEIIIQGDHAEKILQWLKKNGYAAAKRI
jgi:translation initiation factor 1